MALRTPYDGSSKLFQIGVRPLGDADWIEIGPDLGRFLGDKERLLASCPDEVFAALPGTEAAGAEALSLVAAHLPRRYPEIYCREGDRLVIRPLGRRVPLEGPDHPLLTAARLVPEDLVLLVRDESCWRLAAASLSFPSSWRLAEKLGRPLDEVHAPVPGFGAGTRNATIIARMFDNLRPETPVLRWNWSIYGDDALFHPHDSPPHRFGMGARAENVFLRVERQTLTRLPATGAILFSIRIFIDPLAALERHPDAGRIATALTAQLEALDPDQLAYKGLTFERERLAARLAEIALAG